MVRRGSFHSLLLFCAVVGVVGCGRPAPDPRDAVEREKDKVVAKGGWAGGKVKPGETVEVPFIFWGGDVATFVANGGLETSKGSLFDKHGLNVQLTPGDDFDKQVSNYLDAKSPFLRGTLSMLGQASDKLTAKPETVPVVFLQLTWSAGDHLVGRADFKSLDDIKGKKIALQKGGPHVGMLNDILRIKRLEWSDIRVVWTDDVSGDKGPAALFRKDAGIDACFAISPEMTDLTGGRESTGNGEKNTIQGTHVVVSTAQMSHSIADVYACRRDFYDANKDWVEKFAAAYLKGSEDLVGAKKQADGAVAGKYKEAVHLAQDIWGKDPTLKDSVKAEDDVDGLISDATFAGLPGNVAFFTAKGNLTGFAFKTAQALKLPDDPATQPFKTNPKEFRGADLNFDHVRQLGGLTGKAIDKTRFDPEIKIEPEKKIFSFNIYFGYDKTEFPAEQYGEDFQRALEAASLFGNAVVDIRGHATPNLFLERFLDGAKRKGVVKEEAADSYTYKGKPLDLGDAKRILEIIETEGDLRYENLPDKGDDGTLKEAVQALAQLSQERAAEVRRSVVLYAQGRGLVLDESQFRSEGVGVREPVFGNPKSEDETAKNRRVEFSIIRVPANKVLKDEFGL